LLHTSDWHLGRSLYGVDLISEQRSVLDQIVALAAAEKVDLIVIAGDVYDRAVPGLDAVRLLDDILLEMSQVAPVVIIPGNHDSATRLGFGSRLLRDGVHIVASLDAIGTPITFDFGDEHVAVYGIPFLDPEFARHALAFDPEAPLERSHAAVFGAALDRVRADLGGRPEGTRSVVLAHAFVASVGSAGERSDSERDLRVGGVDIVPAGLFHGVDYVALGHLHGPQQPKSPDGRALLRYSGSLLRYSFSEWQQEKSVTLVEVDDAGATTRVVPIVQPRGMHKLVAPIDEILAATDHLDDWVSVVVTDQQYPSQLQQRIKARYPYALEIRHAPPTATGQLGLEASRTNRDPADVFTDFVTHVTGEPPSADDLEVLTDAFEAVLARERSR
jgi:exonuclease SbcD